MNDYSTGDALFICTISFCIVYMYWRYVYTKLNNVKRDVKREVIHGFKILNTDMTGMNAFQYEIGKTYIQHRDIELCASGFHFCRHLPDCLHYIGHLPEATRFFRIEASTTIKERSEMINRETREKTVSDQITLTHELTADEVANILSNRIYSDYTVYFFFRHCMRWKETSRYAHAIWKSSSKQRKQRFVEMALFLEDPPNPVIADLKKKYNKPREWDLVWHEHH